jgi:putative addiction module component (TIGR02574 family)
MPAELQAVLTVALQLSDSDREVLADRLWESLEDTSEEVPADAWAEEIRQRLADIRSGRTAPVPEEEARRFILDDSDDASD